ncbi:hypothetical protein OCU04_008563 [Sclerotinia nivalis]|uniref:Uncharacterized protein n=1 Tax=Sclerotinia nivalis TaxID=352851 RepID=A0A9X0DHQ9_9HELO|nr:hypothetical protein OCU04_008563 [Sclerotinia nivalis]
MEGPTRRQKVLGARRKNEEIRGEPWYQKLSDALQELGKWREEVKKDSEERDKDEMDHKQAVGHVEIWAHGDAEKAKVNREQDNIWEKHEKARKGRKELRDTKLYDAWQAEIDRRLEIYRMAEEDEPENLELENKNSDILAAHIELCVPKIQSPTHVRKERCQECVDDREEGVFKEIQKFLEGIDSPTQNLRKSQHQEKTQRNLDNRSQIQAEINLSKINTAPYSTLWPTDSQTIPAPLNYSNPGLDVGLAMPGIHAWEEIESELSEEKKRKARRQINHRRRRKRKDNKEWHKLRDMTSACRHGMRQKSREKYPGTRNERRKTKQRRDYTNISWPKSGALTSKIRRSRLALMAKKMALIKQYM